MKYKIILKSGIILHYTSKDATKNLIGLWVYLLRRNSSEVIDFVEGSVLVQEIAVLEEDE